jgi:hypothetical protein
MANVSAYKQTENMTDECRGKQTDKQTDGEINSQTKRKTHRYREN